MGLFVVRLLKKLVLESQEKYQVGLLQNGAWVSGNWLRFWIPDHCKDSWTSEKYLFFHITHHQTIYLTCDHLGLKKRRAALFQGFAVMCPGRKCVSVSRTDLFGEDSVKVWAVLQLCSSYLTHGVNSRVTGKKVTLLGAQELCRGGDCAEHLCLGPGLGYSMLPEQQTTTLWTTADKVTTQLHGSHKPSASSNIPPISPPSSTPQRGLVTRMDLHGISDFQISSSWLWPFFLIQHMHLL